MPKYNIVRDVVRILVFILVPPLSDTEHLVAFYKDVALYEGPEQPAGFLTISFQYGLRSE